MNYVSTKKYSTLSVGDNIYIKRRPSMWNSHKGRYPLDLQYPIEGTVIRIYKSSMETCVAVEINDALYGFDGSTLLQEVVVKEEKPTLRRELENTSKKKECRIDFSLFK